jgi:4-amino-4-deoxy-L-arabinose transferase-like glycosyltransferase
MKVGRTKLSHVAAVALILALAAFMRLLFIDSNMFGDQGRFLMYNMMNIADFKQLPLQGLPLGSLGSAHHGPAPFYLLSIPMFFSRNPIAIYLYLLLLHLSAIIVIYRIGRDYFSSLAGVIASLIFAVDFEFLIKTRWISQDSLIGIFTALFYYSFFSIANRKNNRLFWTLLPVVFAISIQIHFQLLLIAGIMALMFYIRKPSFSPWHFSLGIVLSVLVLSPQIYYEFTKGKSQFWDVLGAFRIFFNGTAYKYHPGATQHKNIFINYWHVYNLLILLYVAAAASVAVIVVKARRETGKWTHPDTMNRVALLLFTLMPLLVFSGFPDQTPRRYYAAFIPMAMLIGVMFDELSHASMTKRQGFGRIALRVFKWMTVCLLAAEVILNIFLGMGIIFSLRQPWPKWYEKAVEKCNVTEMETCKYYVRSKAKYRWTYAYRKKQYEILFDELKLDDETILHRVHGALYYQMFTDDGFIFREWRGRNAHKGLPNDHYLILDGDLPPELQGNPVVEKSVAYPDGGRLLKYQTAIDYNSLKYYVIQEGKASVDNSIQWRNYMTGVDPYREAYQVPENGFVWERTWEKKPAIFMGFIRKPRDFSYYALVFDVIYPWGNGEKKKVQQKLFFNNKLISEEVSPIIRTYKKCCESYRFIYRIESEQFREMNSFVLTFNAYPEYKYTVDIYDLAFH